MGSNRTGEVNCKIYSEDREALTKRKTNKELASSSSERNGKSPQTPEYVKRTAKLFESVHVTEEVEVKNGVERKVVTSETREASYETETRTRREEEEGEEKGTVKISLDSLDGDLGKKPSYLGVSCSNSGYRNVINYDSKLREGFWTANSQRESLVLCNSRLRENSPMRRDFEFKRHNGNGGTEPAGVGAEVRLQKGEVSSANGVSRPEKFVNVSTSTKTISTFRKSKDVKSEELENHVNGLRNFNRDSGVESKVNLKSILNGKGEDTHRKGYSNLGFSPKILKSPEKNCNSFLKSINSFENNCKKSQTTRSSPHLRTEHRASDSNSSIQQRIERLYGPGALAQAFYAQKSAPKTNANDRPEESSREGNSNGLPPTQERSQPQTGGNAMTNSSNLLKATPLEVASTEPCSNGHVTEETAPQEEEEEEDTERNGRYFLKLLKKETDRLERLACFAESELENGENLPEEASGKLRAAAGKARLLACQKLRQFEGLCHKNLNEKPGEEFPTTSEDLAGFWDMVMLQVVQVHGVFDEIEELKKNNWKATPKKKEAASPASNGQAQPTRTTPKKSTPNGSGGEKPSEKSESAKKAREEGRRKLLEERRRKMKELKENKILNNDNEVEIFAK